MTAATVTFSQWLAQARDRRNILSPPSNAACSRPLSLPPTPRHRLLLHPPAQPFPAPLRHRPQGRPDRPPARHQPAHRLAPARPLLQGGHPAGPPPHGRPALRQTPAALRRPHRRVPPRPTPTPPAPTARLHRATFGVRVSTRRPAPLPQEVRPRSRSRGRGRPDRRGGRRSPAADAAPGAAAARRRAAGPPPLAAPLFFGTHAVRRRLPADAARPWTGWPRPRTASPTTFGSLRRGLLTSVFALVVGLERIFHLDQMEDPGFAVLDRRPPLPVAATPSAAGGGTCPGTRSMPSAAAPAPGT